MGPSRCGASLLREGREGPQRDEEGGQEDGEDAELRGCTEDGELEVAQHRAEIGQGSHAHEDDGRQETGLDQRVVQVVHQAQLVGDLMQGHAPDRGLAAVGQRHHALGVRLDHAHVPAGEVAPG